MTPQAIGQLAIILAPMLQSLAVEGTKTILTYRENVTQEQIDKSLELSKSVTWPELTFGLKPLVP